MFSLVGGSIHKTKIAYGCVLLLGSASVAGVAVGDSNGKWFSLLSQKISGAFGGGAGGSSSSSVGQQNGLVTAWGWVRETGKDVFNWTIKPTAVAFSQIHKTYNSWWTGLKTFFVSLSERQMYTMLFEKFHTKIKNTLSFFLAGGNDRKTFIDLFKTDKIQSTLKAGKFLLKTEKVKGLEVEQNVFNFLLFKWLEEPKKVTGKFQRLSDYVDRISGKTWGNARGGGGGGGGSGSSSSSGNGIYKLTTNIVKEYLGVEEGVREKAWLFFLYLRVKSTIEGAKAGKSTWSTLVSLFNSGGGH
ncbi:hypothetical protein WEN_02610 [Mycoplasma wenyonii str. Massachusetts]|uniref:Uncharacterized protein n=1 Tax=Mycoplasma wenyonii (strain Massachusetts) TaxID=1197325 RepID=I6ZFC9_MYCWM|nr:hypothetical protein [Mycoplasma wenyonii]AFN65307.1 hypothetical protein WEN_02610 [Mycoplasma wenyonii str. Massachusetts]